MKNKTLRGLLRLAAFGLCFVPVLLFANTFLIKTDTYARLTLAEMKQRSDIVVRSSVPPSCATISTPR
ncbi:MAG: hypothetical protein ACLS7Z_01205 [Christensenellales bacterium]